MVDSIRKAKKQCLCGMAMDWEEEEEEIEEEEEVSVIVTHGAWKSLLTFCVGLWVSAVRAGRGST